MCELCIFHVCTISVTLILTQVPPEGAKSWIQALRTMCSLPAPLKLHHPPSLHGWDQFSSKGKLTGFRCKAMVVEVLLLRNCFLHVPVS